MAHRAQPSTLTAWTASTLGRLSATHHVSLTGQLWNCHAKHHSLCTPMLKSGSYVAAFLNGPYGRHSQTMGTRGTRPCGMAAPTLGPCGEGPSRRALAHTYAPRAFAAGSKGRTWLYWPLRGGITTQPIGRSHWRPHTSPELATCSCG